MGISTERFEEYVSLIAQTLGHADRVEPFRGYCTGLLLPVKRKSVEPMAAQLAPTRVRSEHQRLHHFVADAPWSDQAVLDAVRARTLERVRQRVGKPEALLIDDSGFPKKGKHSVGVARQYCGQLSSRTTARSRSRSRWLTSSSVCRCVISCICRRAGRTIQRGALSAKCQRRSSSPPNQRSRCNCWKAWARVTRCPSWWWPMRATG